MKELIEIQSALKAPKGLFNKFGKFYYRSAENILEAVKPLLKKHGCLLTLTDEIKLVGDRYYLMATATITNADGEVVSNNGWARESLNKSGMDDSQITGTASSYARKYALNGLFLIDDTKDADTDEYHNQTAAQPKPSQRELIAQACAEMYAVQSRATWEAVFRKWRAAGIPTGANSEFYAAAQKMAETYPKPQITN